MTEGINNSVSVKITIGDNLAKARAKDNMTRKELCQKLNRCKTPHPEKELTEDVIKMWELGRNTINIEWIPAICQVLHCDVGYLFGEHEEKTGAITDIKKETGLSADAIFELQELKKRDSYYSRSIQGLFSLMLTDCTFIPEIYRSFVAIWELEHKDDMPPPAVDQNGGIYLWGSDAVDAIKFHAQREIVRLLEKFFLSH